MFERGVGQIDNALHATAFWRAAAVVVCVVLAYNYSLQTLVQEMGQQTPLAYLGLVPLIALLLGVVLAQRHTGAPDIHDRYLDYIIGVPLLAVAMGLLVVAPDGLPSVYWLHRLDLFSLPLFAAGAISITFGVRALVRVRAAVLFLFLAWPYPYVVILDHALTWFTDTTAAAVKAVLQLIPVASVAPDGDFLVSHATGLSQSFTVSVSSACSGINSGLGFLIVGAAAAVLMRGRLAMKLLWLVSGTAFLFVVNVGRILLVLAAGEVWGEHFAIDVLHPLIGLGMILGATLVMLLWLPHFYLSLGVGRAASRPGGEPKPRAARTLAVRKARVPLTALAVMSVVAMFANAGMSRFELLAFGLGPSRLAPTSVASAPVSGWTLSEEATYSWAPRYFGTGGTWTRYAYIETSTPTNAAPPAAITVDVIGTSDLGTFSTYGLEACYGFHNYSLTSTSTVDLGGGLDGKVMRYSIPGTGGYWLGLYWEWPVSVPGGEHYQRVVLSVNSSLTANEPNAQRLVNLARELVTHVARQVPATGPAEY
ncbi:MAG TPA: exosortase/archaeosortase family protein [Candidatus Dormibacteraeota bacterium]